MSEDYSVKAKLSADVGQFIAGFRSAREEYKNFNSAMQKSAMGSDKAVEKSSSIVSKAMKVGAVAVASMGIAAVKTGMDFDAQMSRVGAISGATKGQMKELNAQAIQLGADTAFSAKEAAEGMENLGSAGFNANEIMKAMPGVLNLAAVSGGDVGLAAENAATALRGFGLEASSAGHVSDVFAEAAARTNAEAGDMGEALKMVAPQAHAAGLGLEETAAAVGIMSDAGIKGSMAGSNLAMALTKLQNPSDTAQAAMKKLGFNAYDSAGKMKPLATQVEELRGKLSGMTDKQKQFYLAQIYGVQGGRAMNVLLSAQAGKLSKLTNELKNSDGAAAKMATEMQNNLKSSIEQFGGSLESLSIVVEQALAGSLRKGVDVATDAVGKLTNFISANQGTISGFAEKVGRGFESMAKQAPSIDQVANALKMVVPPLIALEAFKGLGAAGGKTIKTLQTMQADLELVKTGLSMTGSMATKAGSLMKLAYVKPLGAVKNLTVSTKGFLTSLKGGPSIMSRLGGAFTTTGGKAKQLGSTLVNAATHPLGSLGKLAAGMGKMQASAGNAVTAGLKPMLTTLGATPAQAAALAGALGPLVVVAAAVALAAAAVYAAWASNFGNIRGVVSSVVGSIKGIFESMKPSINAIGEALKPIGTLIGNIFKVVGVGIIVALAAAAIGLATAIRLVVDAVAAIAKVAQAAFYGLDGLFKKMIPGGDDGAKSMKKAGAAIDDAGQSIGDMKQAFVDAGSSAVKGFQQFGKGAKQAQESSKAASVAVKDVSNSVKGMKAELENSKADFSQLIDTDGVSAKTKKFLTDTNNTLTQYQDNAQKASDKYSKAMTAADKKTGDERVKAINEANAKLAAATQRNGQNLVNISADLDRQLAAKKFTDGTKMTADQVKVLTDQNNQIKAKLLEQNQIYTQAQLSRLQNGQKLNAEDWQATLTTLQSNFAQQTTMVQQNAEQEKQLKAKIAAEKDVTSKAQMQQELSALQTKDQQLLAEQQNFGTQTNQVIANGRKLDYQIWSMGLEQMGNVTTTQLGSMYASFVQMNGNTGQQMQAFALTLQKSGTKGVTNLVQALSTGKATVSQVAAAISKDGTAGLNTLPPGMFKKGSDGKNKFIQALKSGDFKGAGKYLATQSAYGANDRDKHKKSGKNNADAYIKEIKNGKSKTKVAAQEMAKSGADGLKSKKSDYKNAGESNGKGYTSGVKSQNSAAKAASKAMSKGGLDAVKKLKSDHKSAGTSNGKSYVSGVKSQSGSARSAGKALASAAKSGAKGVSFKSVGSQMAAGVAAGIRGNTGAAVSAMASLVSKVNAQAKKVAKIHSPSRLMRDEVGKYLSLGVAGGISDYAGSAVTAMNNMIDDVINSQSKLHFVDNIAETISNAVPSAIPTANMNMDINQSGNLVIEVPVSIDSHEFVKVTARPMQSELNRIQRLDRRPLGLV
ncbi:phage tail tape measure protein [Lapidilactobacillus bayanensis]|uniref:phage tail tape measure protein n=1 Tax=Lapidilactobacillus bayanensis TaxID=2485998 RepID=UPI000F789669|nr:phage tail tape measure protein [Lapidilactobacillus bayanensis]